MPDLFRSRVQFTGSTGGAGVSTCYFAQAGSTTAQDASDAHGDFFSRIKGRISSEIRMTIDPEVLLINTTSGSPIDAFAVTNRTFLGEDGGDPLPWQTQALVKFQTGVFLAGRRLVGRLFVPGICEGSNTNGVPNSGFLSDLVSSADLLALDVSNPLWVYSPTHHQARVASGVTLPTRWASLRSRRD